MVLLNRSRCSALLHAATMLVVLVACTARAQLIQVPHEVTEKNLEETVATVGGSLELYRVEFDDGARAFQFVLKGKEVHQETKYDVVSIAFRHPSEGPARVMLLELTTGGSGCPMLYRVLEVKDNGSIVRSKEFGNCAMAKTSVTNGALLIDLPKIGGAAAQSWRYQNGKLSKAPAKPAPTPKK